MDKMKGGSQGVILNFNVCKISGISLKLSFPELLIKISFIQDQESTFLMKLLGCSGIDETHFEELCFSLKTDWEKSMKR